MVGIEQRRGQPQPEGGAIGRRQLLKSIGWGVVSLTGIGLGIREIQKEISINREAERAVAIEGTVPRSQEELKIAQQVRKEIIKKPQQEPDREEVRKTNNTEVLQKFYEKSFRSEYLKRAPVVPFPVRLGFEGTMAVGGAALASHEATKQNREV